MLAADKLLLQSTIRKNATQLKGKELELHKDNFDAVGTQAAVLAGFAIVLLVEFHMPDDANPVLQSVFYFCAMVTLVANMRCVALTTCITVMGTGLALRGPDGSMVRAVEGMYKQRFVVFVSFGVGIVFCHFTALVLCFIKMRAVAAIPCSALLLWALASTGKFTRNYASFFVFNEEDTVSFDDILGSSLVNNEALMRQLGLGNDSVMRMLGSLLPQAVHQSRTAGAAEQNPLTRAAALGARLDEQVLAHARCPEQLV